MIEQPLLTSLKHLPPEQQTALLYRLSPEAWARDQLGIELYPYQRQVAQDLDSTGVIVNVSRRGGKSEICSLLLSWSAVVESPGCTQLITAKTQDQSKELLRRCYEHMARLGISIPSPNKESMELENGSRIIALPGAGKGINPDNWRGFGHKLRRIVIDEAAFTVDAVLDVALPMLNPTPGSTMAPPQLFAISSSGAKKGWFYNAVMGLDTFPGFSIYRAKWNEIVTRSGHPVITPEFITMNVEIMGKAVVDREYNLVFTDAIDTLDDDFDYRSMFSSDVPYYEI